MWLTVVMFKPIGEAAMTSKRDVRVAANDMLGTSTRSSSTMNLQEKAIMRSFSGRMGATVYVSGESSGKLKCASFPTNRNV